MIMQQLVKKNGSLVFSEVESFLFDQGYRIVSKDLSKPWGGYYVLDGQEADRFCSQFVPLLRIDSTGRLSPKILMIAPGKKISWQYHLKRSEIWTLIDGAGAIVRSDNDLQPPPVYLKKNEMVMLAQGERHRLVGLNTWGVVAEIWQHTGPNNPSDEDDIVRLQDDFGR